MSATIELETANLEHLLALARRGRLRGATKREKQARRIVERLIVDTVGLDDSAITGIGEVVDVIQAVRHEGRDIIRRAIR